MQAKHFWHHCKMPLQFRCETDFPSPTGAPHLIKDLVDKKDVRDKAQIQTHGAVFSQQQKHAVIDMLERQEKLNDCATQARPLALWDTPETCATPGPQYCRDSEPYSLFLSITDNAG